MVRKAVGIRFPAAHWCSLLTCWQYNRRLKLVDAPRPVSGSGPLRVLGRGEGVGELFVVPETLFPADPGGVGF